MIETADDYNDRLGYCGCCFVENECPQPTIKYEAIGVSTTIAFYVSVSGEGAKRKWERYYAGGGSRIWEKSQDYNITLAGNPYSVAVDNKVEVPPFTGGITTIYSGVIDVSVARADAYAEFIAALAGLDWDSETKIPGTISSAELSDSASGMFSARTVRFRFQIPATHLGTYFKITYDIGEFPDVGADSLFSQDNVLEWTGPGDTGDAQDVSWFTAWADMPPPSVEGQRRIVNIRYTCRHGAKFPALPQIMGEALEIP